MTATVGASSRSRRSTTACASLSRSSTTAASVSPRNSPMSAPAMKPDGLAERSTKPFGRFFSRLASTLSSSLSTSTASVLALAPALSRRSQAMPSSSCASRQLRQGELAPARSASASGPSSRLRGASVSQTMPIYDPLSSKRESHFVCRATTGPRTRRTLAPRSGERVASAHKREPGEGPTRAAIAVIIAGLDPAIHPLRKKVLTEAMDPRIKPAGDERLGGLWLPLTQPSLRSGHPLPAPRGEGKERVRDSSGDLLKRGLVILLNRLAASSRQRLEQHGP